MSKGKPRHDSNKPANQYGSRCPYYEEYINGTCGCEVHPEIAGDKLKCGGNRHNCVKVQYQKQAIKKNYGRNTSTGRITSTGTRKRTDRN